MPGPQKENGYTPIANELLEAIYSTSFNSTQLKILLFIMRYTYGFSRKEHKMSLNFISKGTGISRRYISSELKRLVELNVVEIVRCHTDTEARILKLNKHYKTWKNGAVQQVKDSSTGEAEQDTTGEELITTTGEELFYQDKQNLKQNINNNRKIAKKTIKENISNEIKKLKQLQQDKIFHGNYYKQHKETFPAYRIIKYFEQLPEEEKINQLVQVYMNMFPEQKKYGTAGTSKANDTFKETMEIPGVNEPEQILKEIVYSEGTSLSPWDIKSRFVKPNGQYNYTKMKYEIDEAKEREQQNEQDQV